MRLRGTRERADGVHSYSNRVAKGYLFTRDLASLFLVSPFALSRTLYNLPISPLVLTFSYIPPCGFHVPST